MPALLSKGVGYGMKLSGNCHRPNHEITGGGREEFLSLEPCGESTKIELRDEKYLGLLASTCVVTAQVEILSIEFNQDDHADFDLWPSALSGTESSADSTTDAGVISGTTTLSFTDMLSETRRFYRFRRLL